MTDDQVALGSRTSRPRSGAAAIEFRNPESRRAPAAPKFWHVLPVFDFSTGAGGSQRYRISANCQCAARLVPEAATVFQARAGGLLKEGRGHFVVLPAGSLGHRGDGVVPGPGSQPAGFTAPRRLPKSRRARTPDAEPDCGIRQSPALRRRQRHRDKGVRHRESSLGRHGRKGLASRWYLRHASPRLAGACASVGGIPVTLQTSSSIAAGPARVSHPCGACRPAQTQLRQWIHSKKWLGCLEYLRNPIRQTVDESGLALRKRLGWRSATASPPTAAAHASAPRASGHPTGVGFRAAMSAGVAKKAQGRACIWKNPNSRASAPSPCSRRWAEVPAVPCRVPEPRDRMPCQPERPQACKRADQRPSGGGRRRLRGRKPRPASPSRGSGPRQPGPPFGSCAGGTRQWPSRSRQPPSLPARWSRGSWRPPFGHSGGGPGVPAAKRLGNGRESWECDRPQAGRGQHGFGAELDPDRSRPVVRKVRPAALRRLRPGLRRFADRRPMPATRPGVVAKLIQGTLVWAGAGHPLRECSSKVMQPAGKRAGSARAHPRGPRPARCTGRGLD